MQILWIYAIVWFISRFFLSCFCFQHFIVFIHRIWSWHAWSSRPWLHWNWCKMVMLNINQNTTKKYIFFSLCLFPTLFDLSFRQIHFSSSASKPILHLSHAIESDIKPTWYWKSSIVPWRIFKKCSESIQTTKKYSWWRLWIVFMALGL